MFKCKKCSYTTGKRSFCCETEMEEMCDDCKKVASECTCPRCVCENHTCEDKKVEND